MTWSWQLSPRSIRGGADSRSLPRSWFMILGEGRAGELVVLHQFDLTGKRENVARALGALLLIGEDGVPRLGVEGRAIQNDVGLAVARRAEQLLGIAALADFLEETAQFLGAAWRPAPMEVGRHLVRLEDSAHTSRAGIFLLPGLGSAAGQPEPDQDGS